MPPYSTSACLRSGYVAAKRIDIGTPSEIPMSTARSDPTASITARTSSMRSSSGAGGTLRSDRPSPRLSKRIRRLNDRQPAEEPRDRRVLPLEVEVTGEALHEHDVEVTFAAHLVRNDRICAVTNLTATAAGTTTSGLATPPKRRWFAADPASVRRSARGEDFRR